MLLITIFFNNGIKIITNCNFFLLDYLNFKILTISTSQKHQPDNIFYQKPPLKLMIRAFFSIRKVDKLKQTLSNTSPKRLILLDWTK